jgi:hypothetical protein
MSAIGYGIAVWTEGTDVYARQYSPLLGWWNLGYPPPKLNDTDGNSIPAYGPRIAMDNIGNAIAVWFSNEQFIYYNIYDNATGGWAPYTPIDPVYAKNATNPRVALNNFGRAIVVWMQLENTFHRLGASHINIDPNLGNPLPIVFIDSEIPCDSKVPRMVMDDEGRAVVLWQVNMGSQHYLVWNTFRPGYGWGVEARLEETLNNSSQAPIVITNNGDIVAGWVEGGVYLYAKTFTFEDGWSNRILVHGGTATLSTPSLAMNNDGLAILSWSSIYNGFQRIFASVLE